MPAMVPGSPIRLPWPATPGMKLPGITSTGAAIQANTSGVSTQASGNGTVAGQAIIEVPSTRRAIETRIVRFLTPSLPDGSTYYRLFEKQFLWARPVSATILDTTLTGPAYPGKQVLQ
jgi:hypothetical protein